MAKVTGGGRATLISCSASHDGWSGGCSSGVLLDCAFFGSLEVVGGCLESLLANSERTFATTCPNPFISSMPMYEKNLAEHLPIQYGRSEWRTEDMKLSAAGLVRSGAYMMEKHGFQNTWSISTLLTCMMQS